MRSGASKSYFHHLFAPISNISLTFCSSPTFTSSLDEQTREPRRSTSSSFALDSAGSKPGEETELSSTHGS